MDINRRSLVHIYIYIYIYIYILENHRAYCTKEEPCMRCPTIEDKVLRFMPTAAGNLGDIQREKPYSIGDTGNFHASSD